MNKIPDSSLTFYSLLECYYKYKIFFTYLFLVSITMVNVLYSLSVSLSHDVGIYGSASVCQNQAYIDINSGVLGNEPMTVTFRVNFFY